MNHGKNCRSEQQRAPARATAKEQAENKSAEQNLLEQRHDNGRAQNCGHFAPEKRMAQGIEWESKQDRAAAEQGNGCNCESGRELGTGPVIFIQPEIAPTAHPKHSEKRPKPKKRGN